MYDVSVFCQDVLCNNWQGMQRVIASMPHGDPLLTITTSKNNSTKIISFKNISLLVLPVLVNCVVMLHYLNTLKIYIFIGGLFIPGKLLYS